MVVSKANTDLLPDIITSNLGSTKTGLGPVVHVIWVEFTAETGQLILSIITLTSWAVTLP